MTMTAAAVGRNSLAVMAATNKSATASVMPQRMNMQPTTRPRRFQTSLMLRPTAAKFFTGSLTATGNTKESRELAATETASTRR